jgi:hypothetical protein
MRAGLLDQSTVTICPAFFFKLVAAAPFGPQRISTAGGGSRRVVVVGTGSGASAGLQGSGGIAAVVAPQVSAAEIVFVGVERIGVSGWWAAGSSRALVGLLLVLAIDLPSSSRDQGSWGGAAGAAGV